MSAFETGGGGLGGSYEFRKLTLGHHYYVGFLSAAAMHGASHQATVAHMVVMLRVMG